MKGSEGIISQGMLNSTNPAYRTMLTCHRELVTALMDNVLEVAGILLSKLLIAEDIEEQMLLHSIPREKATILVSAVRNRIKIAPRRFDEFVLALKALTWTEDIVETLLSTYRGRFMQ